MTDPRDPFDGLGVVYFGNAWQAENRTSSHHVALRLARRMPVLYVESPGLRRVQATGGDFRRALRKLAQTLRAPREVAPNLWHCTVPQLPFRRLPGVPALNRWLGRLLVRRARSVLSTPRVLSWFVVPHPGFMAGRLGEERVLYYCIDDYAAHPGVDATVIGPADEALSRRADLLFVAPPALLESKRALNPNTVYAPHGVDLDVFAAAADPATPVAPAAANLPHPVVGYIGSLHAWIDLELIERCARARPQWTFLLVGHAAVDVSVLAALPNVRLAGAQPYETLGRWARAFDACIIPYRLNRQVANANPLKLREYLATGKPVVSVRNPEIEKFAGLVRIADGADDFLAGLDEALAGDSPQAAAARRAAVADQTWDRRVSDVLARVAGSLSDPSPSASPRIA